MIGWVKTHKVAALFCLTVLHCAVHADNAPHQEKLEVSGTPRSYYVFAPDSATSAPAPLLVLLHGSGSNGLSLVREWSDLANREGLVLLGPDAIDSMVWHIRNDGPYFIRAAVDEVSKHYSIDQRRIYLFGYSGGAVHALTLAMLESEYFAAAALYAGAWRDQRSYVVVPYAKRKIPVSMFVGDKDQFFSLKSVWATRSALEKAGHPVTLRIFSRQGHAYHSIAAQVNPNAWSFLKSVELPNEPHYQPYN
jgi:poly(3-hydroxybutyrate) depolymerase